MSNKFLSAILALFLYFSLLGSQLLLAEELDFSSEYRKLFKLPQKHLLDQQDRLKLADVQIVLIPGILSEAFLKAPDQKPFLNFSLLTGDYFGDQLKHFRNHLGLDAVRLDVTTKDPNQNMQIIYNKLLWAYEKKKPLLLICHSMGGLSTLDALELFLKKYPDGISVLSGVIFLQTPFMGSPVANIINSNPVINILSSNLIMAMGGTSLTTEYLRPENRRNAIKRLEPILEKLKEKKIVLCVASFVTGHTAFEISRNIMANGTVFRQAIPPLIYKGPKNPSDGMVPLPSGTLANFPRVIIRNMDHGMSVVNPIVNGNFNRVKMMEALVKIFINDILP